MEKKSYFEFSPRTYNLIFLLILSVSYLLISISLRYIKFAAPVDEGYYLKYATYISKNGISGFSVLFKEYVNNQQHWVYPNPLRIGFIVIASFWIKLFGGTFLALAYLSLFSFSIFLFISYYFVKKNFGAKVAILFTLLLAFSPLNMAMARRALMDATVNLFTASSIWFFYEYCKKRKLYTAILFIVFYSSTILTKENFILLSLFFVFYSFLHKRIVKEPLKWPLILTDIFVVALAPIFIVLIAYVTLAGNIGHIISTAWIILRSPETNPYAILFCSGPWFRYLIDFILLSPWVCILAIGFFMSYIANKKWQEKILYFILLSITLIFLSSFFAKNIRYLIFLDMPIRLFAILMLNELSQRFFKKQPFVILTVLVIVISLFDYLNFYSLFVQHGIYDPVTTWLLEVKHIIPWK